VKKSVVSVRNVSKRFAVYHKAYEPLLGLIPFFDKKLAHHTALDNVSMQIYAGEFIGIIGQNGSGKSTLLKIVCGVLGASSGSVEISGKVLSLLELGTGFDLELTGRENLYIASELMGFDTALLHSKIGEIEVFADIEEYFDAPMKTYSSGMYVRLAMAMFLHLEPEIFIIDEALGVGDIFFQQKCFAKIEEMRRKGVTFILVSHDLGLIQKVCDKVAYMEYGRLIYFGDRIAACKLYYESGNNKIKNIASANCDIPYIENIKDGAILNDRVPVVESKDAKILALRITDEKDVDTLSVEIMGTLRFNIVVYIDESLTYPGVSLLIKNRTGLLISCINHDVKDSGVLAISFEVEFSIEAGEYSIDLSIGNRIDKESNMGKILASYESIGPISVLFDYHSQKAPFYGICRLNTKHLGVQKCLTS